MEKVLTLEFDQRDELNAVVGVLPGINALVGVLPGFVRWLHQQPDYL